jgi:hypothetical protein
MIVDYEIITSPKSADIEKTVCNMIKLGWQPQGGVSITMDGLMTRYAQAMIKVETEEIDV